MTREELKTIPRIEKLIKYKKEQLEELRELATCVPALNQNEKVQTTIIDRGMPQIDRLIDLDFKIREDQRKLINLKAEAYDIIRELKGAERELMELRYINGKRFEEIATEMNRSYRHVIRLHGKILEKIFRNRENVT